MADERGVLLLDDRRVFVAANDAAAELLGTERDQLLGRRADQFMPLVARPLYPLAWKAFLLRRVASGEYAALRPDGSHAHLAYVGFANRPIRGLHFFVLEALAGEIDDAALVPRMQREHLQLGLDLPDDVHARLAAEADRAERRLPLGNGDHAVVAALFDEPAAALDVLDALRRSEANELSVATAAGSDPKDALTVLAGRVPYAILGQTVASIHERGGRVITSLDERYVWRGNAAAGS